MSVPLILLVGNSVRCTLAFCEVYIRFCVHKMILRTHIDFVRNDCPCQMCTQNRYMLKIAIWATCVQIFEREI